ncbi:MAG TPA: TRAP transporter small permease [Burkholderiaceae bacterium]|nr:TRAP transporter small permease [Burkholderiaceae bacterium]
MTAISRVLDALSNGLAALGRLVLLITMLHVTLDVVLRFFFNRPLTGTVEISSYYYMIAVVFLPLAAVELRNGHISVEIVAQHLSEGAQRVLIGIVCLLSSVFYALLTWRTGLEAIEKMHVGERYSSSMDLSIWPPRFMLPLGCGLLTLVLVVKGLRLLSGDAQPLAVDPHEHFQE